MDYLFEQLGAETFQQLCQSLLLKDYPDLQCFPVGQPDGGRDALSREDGPLPTVIGQVKYKRKDEEDNSDWMIDALKGELPKIERLKKRGANRYLMLTNASGTAHEDTGRIDRAQKWLNDNSPVPGQVLWRDDLSRRLDHANALKLTYPAILNGEYALAMIYEALLAPQAKHLAATMKSFVAEQYRKDSEVKFRQIELSNSLTALFVDVPVNVEASLEVNPRLVARNRPTELFHAMLAVGRTVRGDLAGMGMQAVGTADLLMDREFTALSPRMVLQGAPGQGKSTLAQYVCQVHRARFLDKPEFFTQISERHASAPFRMPFKVDLRDFADFIDGRDYLKHPAEANPSSRTFERFLAQLVCIQGGSDSFGVDELRAVLSESSALLFLDGLDEVADLELRREILEQMEAGVHRLSEIGADLQIVITSRPAQLGQAAPLNDAFTKVNLGALREDVVLEYADKWITAKGLEPDHADEVRQILSNKLDVSHIRELTKNPMQLTILLSLISQIGQSLPDVRTDLYREYVKVFMNREAEKDAIVQAHKPLLLRIVEYLAWVLQSGAEAEGSSGSISSADLKNLVRAYLEGAAQGLDILDDLFSRGLDRIYVLVQRIDDMYEFEVQPLREYFAAKFLYSSAPVGYFRYQEVHGDRLERFVAIAGNPYWANVTRFYAGFWEPGEVGALSVGLREMIASPSLEASVNARAIGASLLTDRTFAVKPFVQDEVIDSVFDSVGMHLAALNRLNGLDVVRLPEDCGQKRFARKVLEEHIFQESEENYLGLATLLRENGGQEFAEEFESWVLASEGSERSRRLRIAAASGALDESSVANILACIHGDHEQNDWELAVRFRAVMSEIRSSVIQDPEIVLPALEHARAWGGYHVASLDTDFAWLVVMAETSYPIAMSRDLTFTSVLPPEYSAVLLDMQNEGRSLAHQASYEDAIYAQSAGVRAALGDCWATYRQALLAESMLDSKRRNRSEEGGATSLLAEVLRGRRARGKAEWWASRIGARSGVERLFWIAILLAWGGSAQLKQCLSLLESEIGTLGQEDLQRLHSVLTELSDMRRSRGGRQRAAIELADDVSGELAKLLTAALGAPQTHGLPAALLESEAFVEIVRASELSELLYGFEDWFEVDSEDYAKWIEAMATAHELRMLVANSPRQGILDSSAMPLPVASDVVRNSTRFGGAVVVAAVSALHRAHNATPVGEVAERDSWTFE